MRLETSFTRLVDCALPIQQAPIGFAAGTADLPLAVARAGGHGMLAAVRMPTAALADRLAALNAETRAYGVNFIQAIMEPEAFELAAAEAPMIEFYFGPSDPRLVERAHRGGALVSRQVVSADEARAAEDEGCDVVVARSIEAGGRTSGGIGLIPLLDSILDAVQIPVVAAGGIATGRGVAAALAAGAGAVRVGTRFLAATEAQTHPAHVDALLAAGPEDTVMTDRFSVDGPVMRHRVLRSALAAAEALPDDVIGEMTVYGTRKEIPRFAADNPSMDATGRVEAMALYAGESAGAVRELQPAAEIVRDLAEGAARRLAKWPQVAGATGR